MRWKNFTKSKIPKPTKKRSRPEAVLQATCCRYLDVACPNVLYWHNVNSQIMSGFLRGFLGPNAPRIIASVIRFLHSIGMRNGVPDLTLHWHYQRTAYLELKIGSNTTSPDQDEIRAKLEAIGIPYFLVRSLDDLKSVIKQLDIPCREVIHRGLN